MLRQGWKADSVAERKISSASMAETEVEAAVDEGAVEEAAAAALG